MLTNGQMLDMAMAQSAVDLHCSADAWRTDQNQVVISEASPGARSYCRLPYTCHLVSYGANIVASVHESVADEVRAYLERYPLEYCFEPPALYELDNALRRLGMRVSYQSEYFLPDARKLCPLECGYELRVLPPQELGDCYRPEWDNALSAKRPELDALAVGAFDGGTLVGLAGCSADCEAMWQIGVDVLPDYRRKGIAAALTSRLAVEVLERGKVPYYGVVWANLGSVRNALASGFYPAWLEMGASNQ